MHTNPKSLRVAARRASTVATAASCLLAAVVTISPAADAAGPGSAVRHGAGAVIAGGTDYVGQYRVTMGGKTLDVYCINPTRREPGHITLSTVTRVSGLSATASREMAEVLTAHGQTSSQTQAEATSQALNYLAGNRKDVARRSRYIARSTQKLAMSYVAEAIRLRGGYTVRVRLSVAALPGQSGEGSVTVAAAGGPQSTTVTLSHTSNVSTPRTVKTNSRGVDSFSYKTLAGGEVHVTATAADLAPTTLRVSQPAAGYQRMVSDSAATSAHGSASYQGRVSGFSNSYQCTSQCDGHPPLNLRACAPASSYASRISFAWAGGSKVVNFAASKKSTCTAVTVTLADGARVTGAWQYRTSRGWTGKVAAGGTFVVDCPAAPPVAVAMSYSCTTASITVELGQQTNGTLTAERNSTKHAMVLVVTGAVSGRYPLAAGATATAHTWPVTCGNHASITVQSGVQRAGGGWNYGQAASITTP